MEGRYDLLRNPVNSCWDQCLVEETPSMEPYIQNPIPTPNIRLQSGAIRLTC